MSTIVYATDEDIALRASADFALLCPRDQKLAYGADGSFNPADRWTLLSTTVNFAAQGVAPGMLLLLTAPVGTFKPPGEALVVVSATAGSVTLRRKGQPAGVGQPPSPAAGLTGVEFTAPSLVPQIARAGEDLNRRYGIDDLLAGRRSGDLADPKEIRDAVVLTVLHRQYLDMSREAGSGPDIFAAKAGPIKAELDDLLARVVVRWNSLGGLAEPSTSRFSTRLAR